MTDIGGLLSRALEQSANGIKLRDAVVVSPRQGGINISYQGQLVPEVAVCDGYSQRMQAGDVVACLVVGTRWLVLDKIGVSDASQVPTTDISWSDAPPTGTGWQPSASGDVFVKTNKIHVVRPAGSVDPASGPVSSSSFPPVASKSYANGHINGYFGNQPVQGSWSGSPNTAVWFYGSQISTFCAGKSSYSMTIGLERADDGSGDNEATVHLYLVAEGAAPYSTPVISNGWTVSQKMAPGTSLTGDHAIPIPDLQAGLLATGQYNGVAAFTTNHSDYIVFTTGCGSINVSAH